MGHFLIINPRTGMKEQIKNAEFYPAYLFLPEEAFVNYPSIVNSITRYPRRFLHDPASRAFVASSNFLQCMTDSFAYLAWPAMAKQFGLCRYIECYSGYDIAWQIAHATSLWTVTMETEGIIPTPKELFGKTDINEYFGFVPQEELAAIMNHIVPLALKNSGLDKIIEVGIEYRCIEDFDFRNSNKKTDFYRKWYHSRTKLYKELHNLQYKKRSEKLTEADLLDELVDTADISSDALTDGSHDPGNWNTIHLHEKPEPADPNEMTDYIETKIAIDNFLMQIPQEYYDLLMMGFQGKKQKEIAEALKLETHSAVSKRRKRLITEFERFSGVEINKKAIRRKKK